MSAVKFEDMVNQALERGHSFVPGSPALQVAWIGVLTSFGEATATVVGKEKVGGKVGTFYPLTRDLARHDYISEGAVVAMVTAIETSGAYDIYVALPGVSQKDILKRGLPQSRNGSTVHELEREVKMCMGYQKP